MIFLIASVVLFNLIVVFMKKRISKPEMYATSFFALVLQIMTDVFLDLKYDLYGYFEKGVDALGLIPIFGIYPAINMIYLNFFPLAKGIMQKIFYICCWSVFALIYEWLAVKSGFFYHNGWRTWYSAPINPVLFTILISNLKFVRWLQTTKPNNKKT